MVRVYNHLSLEPGTQSYMAFCGIISTTVHFMIMNVSLTMHTSSLQVVPTISESEI
jgi:hypothetical protein